MSTVIPFPAVNSTELIRTMAEMHRGLHDELTKSRERWKTATDDEEQSEHALNNTTLSVRMMTLRDVARILLGRDLDDDDNPFYAADDY